MDFLYLMTKGWIECAGIADRCDYDLRQHSASGENFTIEKTKPNLEFIQKLAELFDGISEKELLQKFETFIDNPNTK